jgi:hypothetical protein
MVEMEALMRENTHLAHPVRFIVLALMLWLVPTSNAYAQYAATFDELPSATKHGQKLFVFDREGDEVRGRLESVNGESLVLTLPNGTRTFSADDIVLIRTPGHDSVLNGAAIGGGVMAGLAAVTFAACEGDCRGVGTLIVTNFIVGAGIGALVDAFILTPRDVYRVGKRRLDVQPVVTGTAHGAQVVLRW